MEELWRSLFDTSGFPPRWHCGTWSSTLGWLHIASDLAIWFAYMGIPVVLVAFVRRRRDVPFPPVFWLFSLFIASCGIGHLLEATAFWWPAYRLTGTVKLITAVVSVATMLAIVPFLRRGLALPGTSDLLARLSAEQDARKRSQAALQLTQEQLRIAVAASGLGLWSLRVADRNFVWSETLMTLLGVRVGGGGPGDFFERIEPTDRPRFERTIQGCIHDGTPIDVRIRVRHEDGALRHVVCRAAAVRDGESRITHVTGACLDVTSEEHSREIFRLAVEAAPNAMVMIAHDGRILLVNSQAEKLFGYPREEIVGEMVERLVPDRSRAVHVGYRDSFFENPTARPMGVGRHLTGLRKDGSEVPLEIGLNPIHLPEGTAVLSAIVDITERIQAQDAARAHAAELERRNRALDEFAYLVSHDLKAPLRGISLVAEWLKRDHWETLGEDARLLDTLIERSRHLDQMIHAVLEHARAGQSNGRVESVDAGAVARHVVTSLAPPDGIRVTIGELPRITYDAMHLEKVLQNLIGNAIKHMGKATGSVEVHADDHGDQWRFRVVDDGPGIDPKHTDRIFRMFQTATGKRPNSGIGLAIVRTIVERHGGSAGAESEPGKGSTFWFTVRKG